MFSIFRSKLRYSTIERLNLLYFQYTGQSPEYSFWGWLGAIGIEPRESELLELEQGIKDNPHDYFPLEEK